MKGASSTALASNRSCTAVSAISFRRGCCSSARARTTSPMSCVQAGSHRAGGRSGAGGQEAVMGTALCTVARHPPGVERAMRKTRPLGACWQIHTQVPHRPAAPTHAQANPPAGPAELPSPSWPGSAPSPPQCDVCNDMCWVGGWDSVGWFAQAHLEAGHCCPAHLHKATRPHLACMRAASSFSSCTRICSSIFWKISGGSCRLRVSSRYCRRLLKNCLNFRDQ